MVLSTFMTLITRCCVTGTTLTRYAELCKGLKPQAKHTTPLLLTMVRKIIIEISIRYVLEVNYSYHLSGLPP